MQGSPGFRVLCLMPLAVFTLAFLALPLVRLARASLETGAGAAIYLEILSDARYLGTLLNTVLVSVAAPPSSSRAPRGSFSSGIASRAGRR